MTQRLISSRPAVTRLNRPFARGTKLESLAAEFALLAQRRARLAHQLDLLSRQRDAAGSSLYAVQARMAQLAQQMDQIDPGLRPPQATPEIAPPPQDFQRGRKIGAADERVRASPPNPPPFLRSAAPNVAAPAFRRALPPRRRPFLPE
jgi:hypothetical protein